ncbi:hypothetical protein ACWC2K_09290 [Streptomyces chattanoogensis]|uniref:hypothetical protein n=1 Tax=Streptomyces chattanoogensis TaxID=66876 RepID=UPI00369CC473
MRRTRKEDRPVTARRPLLTAAAAGSVLCALWFVPSANAGVGDARPAGSGARPGAAAHPGAADGDGTAAAAEDPAGSPQLLADTGSPDTTPYVIGAAGCLALGAGLVGYSVRRGRYGEA